MHGRLKVRTTAEQAEIKRKEREKKALAFTGGMKEVFQNRYVEDKRNENLKITEKLLSGNPDVSTLWNIRKEIFLSMINLTGNIDELFRNELLFLQNCLYVNPKSYGVWNQRMFVMQNMAQPNWNEELHLCNLFLKHDERNFHCWDYRRFVVQKSNVSQEDELSFSINKINENFSNYSAWHYRSKLLPRIYPDDASTGHVKEEMLLKEFELAQNAFFTDPNDQSAWFYQRWLLGRKDVPPKLLSVSIQRNPGKIALAFSKAININNNKFQLNLTIGGSVVSVDWKTCEHLYNKSIHNTHSCLWICGTKFESSSLDVTLNLSIYDNTYNVSLLLPEREDFISSTWANGTLSIPNESMFQDSHTVAKSSILEDELEACKMLLEEEADNKWTMLTIVYIMHALDMLKYETEILELISKLIVFDPMHTGYFCDLRSKYIVEIHIEKKKRSKESLESINFEGDNLSAFSYGHYFASARHLNLNGNSLKSLEFLHFFPFLISVNLKRNDLKLEEIDEIRKSFSGTIEL